VVPERSRRQIERLKKARSAKMGRFVVKRSKPGRFAVVSKKNAGRAAPKGSSHGTIVAGSRGNDPQPRPKIPLLSGGKDPTLGHRFEEELYRSS
jgi:hypothetical protein